jgi:HSP20 family protein
MEKAFSSFPSISMPKMPEASCDVIDEGNQFRVKMNVPGVQKKDIDLNVSDNSLEISAEHKEESEEKKKNYLRKERSDVSYYRTLPLPENVVSGKVKAKMTDGVLEVILPKTKPTPKPKKRSVTVQ